MSQYKEPGCYLFEPTLEPRNDEDTTSITTGWFAQNVHRASDYIDVHWIIAHEGNRAFSASLGESHLSSKVLRNRCERIIGEARGKSALASL